MSEQSFEELLNEQESVRIHSGAVVSGTVISVKDNEIILDIGYKTEGVITKSEYSNDPDIDLTLHVQVGDTLDAKVIRSKDNDGQVSLSYKRIAQDLATKALEEPFANKEVLKGEVKKATPKGLSVEYNGATVFIPASLVADTFVRNLDKFVGQEIEFVLIELDARKRRIIGDRKQLIVAAKEAALQALLDRISVGMIVKGTVKSLTKFGAFVDLGGADGLLHVSEMSWGRIDNPKQVYKVGDEVEAFVKEIKDGKVALSVKFPENNPWEEDGPYSLDKIVTGKAVRMKDFGVFVELQTGIDALLHISQISYERVEKPQDVYKTGDEITAKVVEYDPVAHKISLSVKALLPVPEKKEDAPDEDASVEETPQEAQAKETQVEEAEAPAVEASADSEEKESAEE